MTRTAREVVLAHAITEPATATDFAMIDRPLPDTLPPGWVHVRVHWLSLDPYVGQVLRGRHMGEAAPAPGMPLPGEGIGEILASTDPDHAVGDHVAGHFGWAEEAVVQAAALRKVDAAQGTFEHLGILGMPGLTAWVGATQLSRIEPGMTFCVDAAAGLVGGTAGQIARLLGARAVGIAGGADKCAIVTGTYGFDACVDYRQDGWGDGLTEAAPGGIDVHFENVGQKVLDTVLPRLSVNGQVILCGLADHYGDGRPALLNAGLLVGKRATVRGLVVYDYVGRRQEWIDFALPHLREGRLVEHDDIAEGLEAAPLQMERVAAGTTRGRPLVRVG